jgi:hypothetical protein
MYRSNVDSDRCPVCPLIFHIAIPALPLQWQTQHEGNARRVPAGIAFEPSNVAFKNAGDRFRRNAGRQDASSPCYPPKNWLLGYLCYSKPPSSAVAGQTGDEHHAPVARLICFAAPEYDPDPAIRNLHIVAVETS